MAAGTVASYLAACTFERRDDAGRRGGGSRPGATSADAVRLHRPLVVPFFEAVRIASPVDVVPVAYVSMATRQVYVDREHRDRASWLLDAHISVSTWVWRIPLPGDSPLTPIPPGDEAREFEELPIGAWDPARPLAEGDIRIVLGEVVASRILLECAPIQGTDQRVSAAPFEVGRCRPGPGEPVREDLGRLTSGYRHGDLECGDAGGPVDIYGWVHRS